MHVTLELEPHVQNAVDHGVSGTDILHGELKRLLVEAEEELMMWQTRENESDSAIDSMNRTFWEGRCEALEQIYTLTYGLAFAIEERAQKNG